MVYSTRRISLYRFTTSLFSPFNSQFTFLHWKNRQEHFYNEVDETAAVAYLNPFCYHNLDLNRWPSLGNVPFFITGTAATFKDDEDHLLGLTVLHRTPRAHLAEEVGEEVNDIISLLSSLIFQQSLRISVLYYRSLSLTLFYLISH